MQPSESEKWCSHNFLEKSAFFLVAEARVNPWWEERISTLIRSGHLEEAGALYREFQSISVKES
jgi:hypothetical protein